jgi:hypothetical protein
MEDWELKTPLHLAASQGHLETCRLLIEVGQSRARGYGDCHNMKPYELVPGGIEDPLSSLNNGMVGGGGGEGLGHGANRPMTLKEISTSAPPIAPPPPPPPRRGQFGSSSTPLSNINNSNNSHSRSVMTVENHDKLLQLLGAPSNSLGLWLSFLLFSSTKNEQQQQQQQQALRINAESFDGLLQQFKNIQHDEEKLKTQIQQYLSMKMELMMKNELDRVNEEDQLMRHHLKTELMNKFGNFTLLNLLLIAFADNELTIMHEDEEISVRSGKSFSVVVGQKMLDNNDDDNNDDKEIVAKLKLKRHLMIYVMYFLLKNGSNPKHLDYEGRSVISQFEALKFRDWLNPSLYRELSSLFGAPSSSLSSSSSSSSSTTTTTTTISSEDEEEDGLRRMNEKTELEITVKKLVDVQVKKMKAITSSYSSHPSSSDVILSRVQGAESSRRSRMMQMDRGTCLPCAGAAQDIA